MLRRVQVDFVELPVHPATTSELKQIEFFYLTIVEQDHRTVKKRVWLAKGYGSFHSAWRTIRGVEAVHLIRKGRVRRVAKHDSLAQARFISSLFGVTI